MSYKVCPETWGNPKFNFGDQVSLRSLPDHDLWFGTVTGIQYALVSQMWTYRVLINNVSYLLNSAEDIDLFVDWLEPNTVLVAKK